MSSTVANGTSRAGIDAAAASLMVLLTLSWGLNYVAAKVSYAGYDPVFLSVLRAVIGGFFVLLWCWWRGIRLFSRDGTLAAGALVGALFGLESSSPLLASYSFFPTSSAWRRRECCSATC